MLLVNFEQLEGCPRTVARFPTASHIGIRPLPLEPPLSWTLSVVPCCYQPRYTVAIMALTDAQKKQLRGRSHALKPVVQIGQAGLTANVLQEIEQALNHHELIKLKARVGNRAARDTVIAELLCETGADLIHQIGNVAVIYRLAPGHGRPTPGARSR